MEEGSAPPTDAGVWGRVTFRCRRGQAASVRDLEEWAPNPALPLFPQLGERGGSRCTRQGGDLVPA